MCAVTSIVDRSVRSIESIDGRYGGCWRRSSPKPPSHKPRRRLNSSSTPGPVDCARAVWRETLSWVPFGAAPPKSPDSPPPRQAPPNRPVPHRQVRRCSGKAHSRARTAAAAALARSIARARSLWRWRYRSVTPPATRVTRAARHARARVRHHRASRASSPFSVPPPRTHARAARCDGARSLARSRACGAAVVMVVWRSITPRVTRVTRARVYVITAHRARHHRPPSPMSPMRARGSGGGAVSFARLLARAEAEAVGLGEAVGYIARHACQTRHARRSSRARTRISSPLRARHHRFPSPPRTTGTRARCCGGGARSLARSRARGVALAVEVAFRYTARHARHAHHARACASSPRIARVITAPLPRCHPCARAAAAAARLVCSLARARGGGGGRSFARRACLARHARARGGETPLSK